MAARWDRAVSKAQQSVDMHSKTEKTLIDPNEYSLRKRLPRHLPKQKNDIYVSRSTNFVMQLNRCQKLFASGMTEVNIHGLGAAVNIAMNLALQVQKNSGNDLDISANTSTVELIDDLEPEIDDLEPMTQRRNNSAIHIKLFKSIPSPFVSTETTKIEEK